MLFRSQQERRVARLLAEGALDTTFFLPLGLDGQVTSVAIQPADNKVIIGGVFTAASAAQRNRIDLVVGNAPSKAERPHPERFRTQSPAHASPTVAQAQAVRTRVQKERTPEHRANSGPTHGQGRIEELACCKAGGTYTSAQDTAAPP